ncbi:MAG: LysR family transcriptional regulator [Comamonas sp.]
MATDRLGDMRLFVQAAAMGSLTTAGSKLGFSPAAASARLAKLERFLGVKLFHRTTRHLQLTNEGRIYLSHCMIALRAIEDGEFMLQAGQKAVRGKIRISASTDFGRSLLDDWLNDFVQEHQDIQLALILNDSFSNLHQEGVDIAIRFGRPAQSMLVARRLAPNFRVLCASPDYLSAHGTPLTPDDLAQHKFVVLATERGLLNEYHFAKEGKFWNYTVPGDRSWEVNDGEVATKWAIAGRGITRKTIWDAASSIRTGKLRIVLPEFNLNEDGVYAVRHSTEFMPPRIRALLDFLSDRFEQEASAMQDFFMASRNPSEP